MNESPRKEGIGTVRFVIGGAGSGKTEWILGAIEKTLAQTDKKIILLVPEQQTVIYETALAERFPPEAALRLEATNFTRLANSVARTVGGLSGASVSRGAKALLTWRAMGSVWDSLTALSADVRGAKGYLVGKVSSAREQLRINSVTAEAVEEALESARESGRENEPAFSKLRDVSLIFSAYDSIVREEFGEEFREAPGSRTVALGAERGFFDNTEVFIDSFFSVTKEEFLVFEELVRACDVTVTVAMGDERAPGVHEEPVKSFYDLAASFAYRFTDVEFVRLGKKSRRAVTRELSRVAETLFDFGSAENGDDGDIPSDPESVRIFSVRDRYEEAEAAAAVIEDVVRRGGRFSDVAVIAGDLSSLCGVVESCFARHGIPCFRAEPSTLESSPLARHFLSLLRIPGAWRREDVVRLVKTGLTALSDEDAFALETYTEVWGIRGRRMFNSEWSMNPSGYRLDLSPEDRELLVSANRARETLIPSVESFVSVFDGGDADVADVCRALVTYSEQSGLYGALRARAEKLAASGDRDGAERELRTFSKFCDCFDEIVRFLPGVRCGAEEFSAILKYAMTDVGAGSIPTGVDEVALGSAATVRTGPVRHVILLGCVSGEFPGVYRGDELFSDDEKKTLGEAGVDIWGNGRERAAAELLRFHRCVAMPSESLTLFVPDTSFGEKCEPSSGAAAVLSALGRDKATPFSSLPLKKRLYSPAGIDAAITSAQERGDDGEAAALIAERARIFGRTAPEEPEDDRIGEATAKELFGGDLDLSQSRLNSFVKCPFSYYVKYVLKIGEYGPAQISALDAGTFVHFVLERFFTVTEKKDYPLEDERVEEICDGIIKEYLRDIFGGEIENERVRYLFIGLRRTALLFVRAVMEEAEQSRFEIFSRELVFGRRVKDGPGSMAVDLGDGTSVSFNGKIDRLDVCRSGGKTYVRVVDYKTGDKKFDLEAVKRGIDLQLLIYLFSVWKSENADFAAELGDGEITPAGAMYISVKNTRKTVDGFLSGEDAEKRAKDSVLRSGLFLDDRDALEAMDRGLTCKYLPLKKSGDGEFLPSEALCSLEEFGKLYGDLEKTVAGIVAAIRSGDGEARPGDPHGDNPCRWCRGRAVCRRAAPNERWG